MAGVTCGVAEFDAQPANLPIAREGPPMSPPPGAQPAKAPESSCVQAAVVWYGATDFAQMDSQEESFTKLIHNDPNSSQSRLLGCVLGSSCEATTLAKASALTYVGTGTGNVSFLFQAGDRDEATPWQQSKVLYDALRAKGVPAKMEIIPGANHYFNGATKEQARQVLDTFFKFLDESLGKPAKK